MARRRLSFPQRYDPVQALAFDREHISRHRRSSSDSGRAVATALTPSLGAFAGTPWCTEDPGPGSGNAFTQESVVRVQEVARHLLHPLAAWISDQPHHLNHPTPDVDYEQHVVPNQSQRRHHLHREEVHPYYHAEVRLDEGRPRILRFRSGAGSMPCSLRIRSTVVRPISYPKWFSASRSLV